MGWYGTGIGGEGGVYLSIYQMHTALVTAIRMPPPTAYRPSFDLLKSPVLLIAPLCIN